MIRLQSYQLLKCSLTCVTRTRWVWRRGKVYFLFYKQFKLILVVYDNYSNCIKEIITTDKKIKTRWSDNENIISIISRKLFYCSASEKIDLIAQIFTSDLLFRHVITAQNAIFLFFFGATPKVIIWARLLTIVHKI